MHKFNFSIIKIFIFLFLLSWQVTSSLALEDKVIAIVNQEIVTQRDLDRFLSAMRLELSARYSGKELENQMEKLSEEGLERIIEDRLIVQEAKKQEIEIDLATIDNRLEEIKGTFPSEQTFEEMLLAQGLTIADLRNKIKEQALIYQIIDKEIKSKIFVHPEEVTDYYNGNTDLFQEPEGMNLDSVFIPLNNNEKQAYEKANKIIEDLKIGIGLPAIETKYAVSVSTNIFKSGQLLKDIEDVVFKLNLGEVSSIIKTKEGLYIFRLNQRIPATTRKLSEVKQQIYEILYQEKFAIRFKDWLDDLKDKAYILIK